MYIVPGTFHHYITYNVHVEYTIQYVEYTYNIQRTMYNVDYCNDILSFDPLRPALYDIFCNLLNSRYLILLIHPSDVRVSFRLSIRALSWPNKLPN